MYIYIYTGDIIVYTWINTANVYANNIWLVVWNMFYSSIYGNNYPNWLIFFRGVETTNQQTIPQVVMGCGSHECPPRCRNSKQKTRQVEPLFHCMGQAKSTGDGGQVVRPGWWVGNLLKGNWYLVLKTWENPWTSWFIYDVHMIFRSKPPLIRDFPLLPLIPGG